ncbi:DoxX family protein [Candidatus Omnitrophota bacterium]
MRNETLLDFSMLTLRLVIGIICVAYGAQKLFGTFDGIGLEGTAKMVEGLGLANPYLFAMIWACIEFAGGIFLLLGILARWSAAAIVLTMLIRLWKINLAYGFFIQNGGVEYNLLIIGACIPLILLGGGRWSVWDV